VNNITAANPNMREEIQRILLRVLFIVKWQAWRESNPQPAVLETAALPIELQAFAISYYNLLKKPLKI
tara:strand:- start:244 stop:447 length:204 start_codon:yes stop_codon:yes gene_type:complete